MRHAVVHEPPTWGTKAIIAALLKLAAVAIFLIAILAFPALSQRIATHTLELNTFGRYTDFAPATGLQSGFGGGLRLGYFAHPRWALEGGVGFTREYINGGDTLRRHSNWGFRLGLSWMRPKQSMNTTEVTISRGELATVYPVMMPALRESNPVAIMALEADRADRTQRLAEARVAGLRSIEVHDRMRTTIHFDVGSSAIRPDAIAALESKLDLLRGIPALQIRIEGQADVRGSSGSNITLAWARAEAAKLWLTNRGIPSDRIDAVGFSASRPICEDRNESCLWQNRRAEFVIVAGADADIPRTQ